MDSATFALTAITTFPTIHESIKRFYSTSQNILKHRYADMVQIHIEELDVMSAIHAIESFLHNLNTTNAGLLFCIERIDQIIKKIHTLLAIIEKKLNNYQQNWITWLRGIELSYEIDDLKREKQKLESMIDTLMKMLLLDALTRLNHMPVKNCIESNSCI